MTPHNQFKQLLWHIVSTVVIVGFLILFDEFLMDNSDFIHSILETYRRYLMKDFYGVYHD